ncbi:MAG: YfhO family protein, partial [Bacteroidales bacterium]|nr:YfhO family protein [Bacteroidales bacterium]
SLSSITMEHLTPYNPDKVVYHSKTAKEQLAVFSEIYYAPDWFAYIDGKPADYLRVNYILRGIMVPAGEHTIEFRNEAPSFHRWDKVSLVSSILMLICMGGGLFVNYRRKKGDKKN